MRCFIACFLDDNAIELARRCPHIKGVRWLPPQNLHATLRFLGEMDEVRVTQIMRLIATLNGTPVRTTVSRLDGFPRRRRARVVVAQLEAATLLETWASRLVESLGEPDKPFAPHVTLGRSRGGATIPDAPSLAGFGIRLSAPALYESVLSSSGASYRKVTGVGDLSKTISCNGPYTA